MKRYLIIFSILLIFITITGCSKSTHLTNTFDGSVTDLSKHYLSAGYIVNIYRSIEPLGEDADSLGKGYVTMGFQIITEYKSTYDYNVDQNNKITKMIVTNVRVLKTSKMGDIEDIAILKQYSQSLSDPKVEVKSNKSKYELIFASPTTTGAQAMVWANLNKIALYDESKSQAADNGNQPTLKQVYNELGIERNDVAFKIGFRVELVTVGGKTLYKDYEITVPPVEADITASDYSYQHLQLETSKMETFLEQE